VRRVRRVELFPLNTTVYEADLGVYSQDETANRVSVQRDRRITFDENERKVQEEEHHAEYNE